MEKKQWFNVQITTVGINEKGGEEKLKEIFLDQDERQLRELHDQFLKTAGTDGLKVKPTPRGAEITNEYGDTFEFEKFGINDL